MTEGVEKAGLAGSPALTVRSGVQTALAAARGLRQRGEHAVALARLRDAVRADPDHIPARVALGHALRELERFDEAEGHYLKALERAPQNQGALVGVGHCRRRARDFETALARYRQAAQLQPANPDIRATIGQVLLHDLGRPDEAARVFAEALAIAPDRARALSGLAECRQRLADWAGALAGYRRAIAADPTHIPARMGIAGLLHRRHRFAEAEAEYHAILERVPDHIGALLGLARCAAERCDPSEALARLQQLLTLWPEEQRARLTMAELLRDQGDFDRAAAAVDAILADDPANLAALLSLGRIRRAAGRRESARQVFFEATKRHPADAAAAVELATEELALGHIGEAVHLLQAILEGDPDNWPALAALGELARTAGDSEVALGFFMRAISAPSPVPAAYIGAAGALVHLGRSEDAIDLLDGAEARFGSLPEFAAQRASVLRPAGRWPEALNAIRQSSDQFPHHFQVWQQRIELEMRAGSRREADRLLHNPPTTDRRRLSQAHRLRGANAAENWQFQEAIAHLHSALSLDPANAPATEQLAWVYIMTLAPARAHAYLAQHARLDADDRVARLLRPHVSQSYIGQLLAEYALEPEATAALVSASDRPLNEKINCLLAIVDEFPDWTPAALALLIALRQRGPFQAPPQPAEPASRIPPRIVQYWHTAEIPDDVRRLMDTWRDCNPGHAYARFDDAGALDFLRDRLPGEVLRAYRRASSPAQKADVFRLAYLQAEGGCYIDADDRCLAPLCNIIAPGCGLVVYQDSHAQIGNNFLAAAPHHPVIVRALQGATAAVNRGDNERAELATGPGLLTRAFAQFLAQEAKDCAAALQEIAVLDCRALYSVAAIHCHTSYKGAAQPWAAAFVRKKLGLDRLVRRLSAEARQPEQASEPQA